MKLTKQQRHMVYMIMLAEYESLNGNSRSSWSNVGFPYGLCYVFYDVFGLKDSKNYIEDVIIEYLPELQAKKSTVFYSCLTGWPELNDKQSRIALLKQCIEETADAWPK